MRNDCRGPPATARTRGRRRSPPNDQATREGRPRRRRRVGGGIDALHVVVKRTCRVRGERFEQSPHRRPLALVDDECGGRHQKRGRAWPRTKAGTTLAAGHVGADHAVEFLSQEGVFIAPVELMRALRRACPQLVVHVSAHALDAPACRAAAPPRPGADPSSKTLLPSTKRSTRPARASDEGQRAAPATRPRPPRRFEIGLVAPIDAHCEAIVSILFDRRYFSMGRPRRRRASRCARARRGRGRTTVN